MIAVEGFFKLFVCSINIIKFFRYKIVKKCGPSDKIYGDEED